MNKNRINKKKSGIYSIPLSLVAILFVILFIVGIMTFAKMAIMNREVVEKEVERGNELIQIFIGVEKKKETSTITTTYTTTSGTSTQTITTTSPTIIETKETKIYIKNRWNRASVIDYFVVEAWNEKIISKGEFNPPLILEAGEEIVKDPSDFGLNDVGYKDFGFFKENVRCILLHTKLGNTFGSSYSPVKVATFTIRYHYLNITATTTTQAFSTTANKTYKLIIESHGPFDFSNYVDPKDSPYNYYVYEPAYYDEWGNYHYPSYWNVIAESPSSMAIIYPDHKDGNYTYPAGILISESARGGFASVSDPYSPGLYVKDDPNKCSIGPYSRVEAYPFKWELWEVDENGNEIRLVYQKSGNSITFTMDTNYKLKRYFKANCYAYVPPPPPTTTRTRTGNATEGEDYWSKTYLAINGSLQDDGTLLLTDVVVLSHEGALLKYDSFEVSGDKQWLAKDPKVDADPKNTFTPKLRLEINVWFKGNAPPTASITIKVKYKIKYI